MDLDTDLEALRKAFRSIEDHMYCSGVVPLDGNSSTLFFRTKDGSPQLINFLNTDDAQVAALSRACDPASFGRDHEDVLDEDYRKAGKMDSSDFSAQFSIYASGILDMVVSSLLKENSQANDVKAELYKLNVMVRLCLALGYEATLTRNQGPGSFFRPHVDTPRSDDMFGSLVLVFPTKHEGGSLRFRQGDEQWSFDSSDLVASGPRVAFAAFFSDVEHEVLPVTSGYRVTLTYNLYWAAKRGHKTTPAIEEHPFKEQAKRLLAAILANPEYLPDGGLMGFGLTHLYPIDPKSTNLSELRLKGADRTVERICEELGINTSLRVLYRGRVRSRWLRNRQPKTVERRVLMEKFAKLGPGQVDIEDSQDGYVGWLYKWESAVKVLDTLESIESLSSDEFDEEENLAKFNRRMAQVDWVKPFARANNFQSMFIAYGNEARAATAYGEICLVAEVPPAAERVHASKQEENVEDSVAGSGADNTVAHIDNTVINSPFETATEQTPAEPAPTQPAYTPATNNEPVAAESPTTSAPTEVDTESASFELSIQPKTPQ